MVSFRKCFIAFAVLALLAGVASAQVGTVTGSPTGAPFACQAASPATTVRAEGATDQFGDIILTCTGGTTVAQGGVVPAATFTINFNVPVTSRLLSNSTTGFSSGGSEALMLIDEPGSALVGPGPGLAPTLQPANTTTSTQTYVAGTATNGAVEACVSTIPCTTSVPNMFQGTVANTFQLVFTNVPILAPGSQGLQRIFRITNIRGDANFLGTPALSTLTSINAFITVTQTPVPITPASLPVAFAQTGLSTSVRPQTNSTSGGATPSSLSLLQCTSTPTSGSTPVGGAILRFTANFPTAFKTRVQANNTTTGLNSLAIQNIPGVQYNSESGFIVTTLTGANGAVAGLADFGTRLRAVFSNIPAGVNVFVTTSNITPNISAATPTSFNLNNVTAPPQLINGAASPIAVLVLGETAPDFGSLVPTVIPTSTSTNVGNVPIFQVPLTAGAGEVNWEVVQWPTGAQNLDFGVFFQYTSVAATSTTPASPAAGTGTVAMSYSPVPSSPTGGTTFPVADLARATTGPIPRFADTSAANTRTIIQVNLCQTTLLFPYVTNTAGFETGLAIANTSSDTFGTVAQQGACTLTFFGNNVVNGSSQVFTVAPFTTGVIPAGGVWANILSHVTATPPSNSLPGGGNNLTGYMFATCNFQFAHGFAFISDASATGLAEGYLALVVTPPSSGAAIGTPTRGTTTVGPSAAEALVH